MLKLAIFDVDGTLVDSRQIIQRAAEVAFDRQGLPIPSYDEVRQVVGLSLDEALARLAPELPQRDLAELVRVYQDSFGAFRLDPAFVEPLYDGAHEILDHLKTEGWFLALATGKSRRGVDEIVRMHKWDRMFDATLCADDGPGKPNPHMIEEVLRRTGCDRDHSLMIGDTSFDMMMAKSARVRPVGVTWGFHQADELLATGITDLAHTFADLRGHLGVMNKTEDAP